MERNTHWLAGAKWMLLNMKRSCRGVKNARCFHSLGYVQVLLRWLSSTLEGWEAKDDKTRQVRNRQFTKFEGLDEFDIYWWTCATVEQLRMYHTSSTSGSDCSKKLLQHFCYRKWKRKNARRFLKKSWVVLQVWRIRNINCLCSVRPWKQWTAAWRPPCSDLSY